MKKAAFVLIVLVASLLPSLADDSSNFAFGVSFGPHPVGFRVVHRYGLLTRVKPAFDVKGRPVPRRTRPAHPDADLVSGAAGQVRGADAIR